MIFEFPCPKGLFFKRMLIGVCPGHRTRRHFSLTFSLVRTDDPQFRIFPIWPKVGHRKGMTFLLLCAHMYICPSFVGFFLLYQKVRPITRLGCFSWFLCSSFRNLQLPLHWSFVESFPVYPDHSLS